MPDIQNKERTNKGILHPGEKAPDFTLKTAPDNSVSLHDFRGKPVVLIFYPADFSPVCGEETALFNELLPEMKRFNAQLLGISVDSVWSHQEYAKQHNIHFPLLADFHPKGEVAKEYGVYRSQDGTTERALFVIDPEGIIRWSYLSPIDENPGANGVLTALENMQKKKETHGETQHASK
jgi:peroxiredoxin (alkyl hydroperoxide reductase subunit C)